MALKSLDVSHNALTALPPLLLPSLVRLRCTHNQLRALPPSLAGCSQLSHLDVGDNQLASFPRELTRLHRLTQVRPWVTLRARWVML